MISVAALVCILATLQLLFHNVGSVPATGPSHTQEDFEQKIQQVSQAIEQGVTASGSRTKRSPRALVSDGNMPSLTGSGLAASRMGSGVSSAADTGLSALTDTARCRSVIDSMKQFWRLCYGMQTEYGAASLTCLRGPSMARSAVQSCARVVDGQDFDDLIKYPMWLKDLKDEITTVV